MNATQTSLLFFYGIFWAASLNAINVLKPFPTDMLFKKETTGIALKRIAVSVLFANILPIIWLWFLYSFPPVTITANTSRGILFSALVSLSLFSIIRILQGIMLNRCSAHWFYTPKEITDIEGKTDKKHNDPWYYHVLPGVVYIVLSVGIAFLVYYWHPLVSLLKSINPIGKGG